MNNSLIILLMFIHGSFLSGASGLTSIRDFDVTPENSAAVNKINLQKAIDWASDSGNALYVEPSDEPCYIDGGIILKKNVSLIGIHGPTPRGTSHPSKKQPVGSVFAITDRENPFITVESGTQIKGIQFWYPEQTINDPAAIIPYQATIQVSKTSRAQGSIIANTGEKVENIHPIIIEGQGHTSLSNVEAFSGGNGALTTVPENMTWDFMLVRGDKKLTVSVWGSRMRNYKSDSPATIENDHSIIYMSGCFDKHENLYNLTINGIK